MDAPNPVGLDGHVEALCPPYVSNMREAVDIFVQRKFGPEGAYDPGIRGPWKDAQTVEYGVTPYSEKFLDCMGEVAQYVHDTYGKLPITCTTMVLPGYVQAVRLDTDVYDAHYQSGAYLVAHAQHMERWHADGSDA